MVAIFASFPATARVCSTHSPQIASISMVRIEKPEDFQKIVDKKDNEIADLIKKVLKFDNKKDKVERFIDSYAFSRLMGVNDETFSKVERKVNAMLN